MLYPYAAIDPGVHVAGLAFADARHRVTAAYLVREVGEFVGAFPAFVPMVGDPTRPPDWYQAERFVYLEDMQAQRNTHVADLLAVSRCGGLLAGRVAGVRATVRLLPPAQWKGNLPKAIHHARVMDVLDPEERAAVNAALASAPKGHHKELLDAVGILLYGLGRTTKAGTTRGGSNT